MILGVGTSFGIWVLVAGVVLAALFSGIHALAWRRRWSGSFAGLRARLLIKPATNEAHRLEIAVEVARWIFDLRGVKFDPYLEIVKIGNVRSDTVLDGKLPDGSIVRGSLRTERCFPFTPIRNVIIVVDQDASALFLHEAIVHLLPALEGKGTNASHGLAQYDLLERQGAVELVRRVAEEKEAA